LSPKEQILFRIYIAVGFLILIACLIIGKAFQIQTLEGEHWRSKAVSNTRIDIIEADRGNLYSSDGHLLATSIPVFNVYFDPLARGINTTIFNEKIDSLSNKLAEFSKTKYADKDMHRSAANWKRKLAEARKQNKRYVSIYKKLDFNEVRALKQWPIFNKGRNSGGLIIEKEYTRVWPYNELARRTLGTARAENSHSVGLEGSYNKELAGLKGMWIKRKVGPSTWLPVNDDNEVLPENGKDLVTTLDIDLQDIVENSLLRGLLENKADHGSAVLMDVKTGKIKAIANLGLNENKSYGERYNYAVGEGSEPGSTFKLASMAALLENNSVTANTKTSVGNGYHRFCSVEMKDATARDRGSIPISEAFAVSSNVGIAKAVVNNFGSKPNRFIDYLDKFLLNEKTGISIKGEAAPQYITTKDKVWNDCVTLPWLSVGYSVKLTPLQILTFYNAIANNGMHVNPTLVEKSNLFGDLIEPENKASNKRIVSSNTASILQNLLADVVQKGTAKGIKSDIINLAGKTGTTKISDGKTNYDEDAYSASFVGYFPAENPQYSCVVVINRPTAGEYYGSTVAAPIFKEIAERTYLIDSDLHPIIVHQNSTDRKISNMKKGDVKDHIEIAKTLGTSLGEVTNGVWAYPEYKLENIQLSTVSIKENHIPNVVGMGLKDAIYLLENMGLRVIFSGRGKVQKQSMEPGSNIKEGEIIKIELS